MACGASWSQSWGPGVESGGANSSASPDQSAEGQRDRSGPGWRHGWKTWELVAMVIGFIVFWPIGLAFLVWKLWGEGKMCRQSRSRWSDSRWARRAHREDGLRRKSGNLAFDEYKASELERLERERQRLADEQKAFGEFLNELKMAKDREEFDRFMASRGPIIDNGEGAPSQAG